MNLLTISQDNLKDEHICCAISNNTDIQVTSKKEWIQRNLEYGLVFCKADVRGKCFIEYIPAENAWVPIIAKDFIHINCFWVSGQLQGNGYANSLLEYCIEDSRKKGKKGICVISSPKKKTFLSDPDYLTYKGFRVADSADPFFTLMYLPLEKTAEQPCFCSHVKKTFTSDSGFVIYYTHGCPFTAKYVPILEKVALDNDIPLKTVFLDFKEKAQQAPAAWTNFALFKDGTFLTNEIPTEKKFLKMALPDNA